MEHDRLHTVLGIVCSREKIAVLSCAGEEIAAPPDSGIWNIRKTQRQGWKKSASVSLSAMPFEKEGIDCPQSRTAQRGYRLGCFASSNNGQEQRKKASSQLESELCFGVHESRFPSRNSSTGAILSLFEGVCAILRILFGYALGATVES